MSQFVGTAKGIFPVAKRSRTVGKAAYVRKTKLRRAPAGPPGTARRYVSRVLRDMPLHAPYVASRPEMKYAESALAVSDVTTVGIIAHLNIVATGSSIVAQREGARIKSTGLLIRGRFASGLAGLASRVAMVIVYDRQPQGILPLITDIYTAINPDSYQQSAVRDRFSILGRWDYKLVGNTAAPNNESCLIPVNQTLTFSKDTVYDNTGVGNIPNVTTGGVYLVLMGDTAPAIGVPPTAALNFRYMYGDN